MDDDARTQRSRPLSIVATVVVLTVVCAALYWARAILIPIALAIFFTFVLTPLVMTLQRRGLGRVSSVILVISVSLLVVVAVTAVVGQQMVQLTGTLPDHADRIKGKLQDLRQYVAGDEPSRMGVLINDLSRMFDSTPEAENTQTVVVKSAPTWVSHLQAFLSPAVEALGQAAFTLILVVFMLLKREDLRNRIIRLLGPGRLTTTTKAVDETSRRISQYLLAQLLLNLAFGLVVAIALVVMGISYAPLWGFLAFLMRYVPYVGTWIGMIPPTVFAFAVSDGWGPTIGVVVLFLGLEAVCNNIFEPLLYGSRLGLSEVALLIATAFWLFLWGPVGVLLAWPLTTCLLMCGKYVPQLRFLNILLGDQPVLPARLAFYQRVAAKDHDEALQIVESELATRPIISVVDDTVLPALVEARRDAEEGRISSAEFTTILRSVREIAEDVVEDDEQAGAVQLETPLPVLIAPAKDAADQGAGELLSKLLDSENWQFEVAPAGILTSELIDRIDKFNPAILVIASIPPGGLTHARYLCKRIRRRFPELKMVIGRWADPAAETTALSEELRSSGADEITWTLSATGAHLNGWRTVFANGQAADQEQGGKTGPSIGTLSASV